MIPTDDVCRLLAQAEHEPDALKPASVALNRLVSDRMSVNVVCA